MTEATQGSVEPPVPEVDGDADVGADVRRPGDREVFHPLVGLRVGNDVRQLPLDHQVAVRLLERNADPPVEAERLGVALGRADLLEAVLDRGDEGDVHPELATSERQNPLDRLCGRRGGAGCLIVSCKHSSVSCSRGAQRPRKLARFRTDHPFEGCLGGLGGTSLVAGTGGRSEARTQGALVSTLDTGATRHSERGRVGANGAPPAAQMMFRQALLLLGRLGDRGVDEVGQLPAAASVYQPDQVAEKRGIDLSPLSCAAILATRGARPRPPGRGRARPGLHRRRRPAGRARLTTTRPSREQDSQPAGPLRGGGAFAARTLRLA